MAVKMTQPPGSAVRSQVAQKSQGPQTPQLSTRTPGPSNAAPNATPPAVGFSAKSSFETAPATPSGRPASAPQNFGQQRSQLAHAANSLRAALGHGKNATVDDAAVQTAVTNLAKQLNVNVADLSGKSGPDALNALATSLGVKVPSGQDAATTLRQLEQAMAAKLREGQTPAQVAPRS